jgi:hypothetical protein
VLFQFNGESFLFETGATRFTAAQCKTAFQALRNVAEVDCTITASTDFLVTYQIVFKSFPVLPYENNIFSHDGNPALASFSCNTDQIVNAGVWEDITCTIGELNTDKSYPGKSAMWFALISLFSRRDALCFFSLCQNTQFARTEEFVTLKLASATALSSLSTPIAVPTKKPSPRQSYERFPPVK